MSNPVRISDPGVRLGSISVTQVDTLYIKELPVKPVRSLEFSENKRNFITDKLFAGNIYVGQERHVGDDIVRDDLEEDREEKNSLSWRERFDKKMSS